MDLVLARQLRDEPAAAVGVSGSGQPDQHQPLSTPAPLLEAFEVLFEAEGLPSYLLPFELERQEVAREALRSEEHTSELQSHSDLVCRLLLEKKKTQPRSSAPTSRSPARTPQTASSSTDSIPSISTPPQRTQCTGNTKHTTDTHTH